MEREWDSFKEQRSAAVEEISSIRRKVAYTESSANVQRKEDENGADDSESKNGGEAKDADMDVDEGHKDDLAKKTSGAEKEGGAPPAVNGDDAVEY